MSLRSIGSTSGEPSAPKTNISTKTTESGSGSTRGGRLLFVTGITGFLGRHFIFSQRDDDSRFVVLARAKDEAGAAARCLASIELAHAAYKEPFDRARWLERMTFVVGDIAQPSCGMEELLIAHLRLRNIAEFWHFAASLNFEEKDQQKIWAQNVAGTRYAMQLAKDLGVGRFVYCSTAYSVGKTGESRVKEALHPLPRSFNNLYEESKCMAEHEVVSFCEAEALPYAILRPSIVIGPSTTKSTGGSTTGLYGFLRNLHRSRKALRKVEGEIALTGDPTTKLNVTPVDNVMADVRYLIDAGFPGGPFYHLTSDWYPAANPGLEHLSKLLGTNTITLHKRGQRKLSALEELLARRTVFYASYLDSHFDFERSLPHSYGVTTADMHGFLVELFRELKQESPASTFAIDRIQSFDGSDISFYIAGNPSKPAVVLVNAIGMPVEFWTRFAQELQSKYYVIATETRGVPNEKSRCNLANRGTEAHVADLEAVLQYLSVGSASLVGWCSGAQIALRAAATLRTKVRSIVALNPTLGVHDGTPRTPFEQTLLHVFPRLAKNRRIAELYYNVVYGNRADSSTPEQEYENSSAQATQVLTSTDPALIHLTSQPFRSVEALQRYAILIHEALHDDARTWLPDVQQPVLVYAGLRDATAHFELARKAAALVPHATLIEDESGDHFSFYNDPTVLDRVKRFLENHLDSAADAAHRAERPHPAEATP